MNQYQHLKKMTESDSNALKTRLAAIVGDEHVSQAEIIRSQHGQDEGPDKGMIPDLVAFPGEVGEVSEVRLFACVTFNRSSKPRTSITSLRSPRSKLTCLER